MLLPAEIEISGSWAFECGVYQIPMERPERDEVFQDRGKYIRIYRDLGEGLWKVARDMCNSDKPAFLPALMV